MHAVNFLDNFIAWHRLQRLTSTVRILENAQKYTTNRLWSKSDAASFGATSITKIEHGNCLLYSPYQSVFTKKSNKYKTWCTTSSKILIAAAFSNMTRIRLKCCHKFSCSKSVNCLLDFKFINSHYKFQSKQSWNEV